MTPWRQLRGGIGAYTTTHNTVNRAKRVQTLKMKNTMKLATVLAVCGAATAQDASPTCLAASLGGDVRKPSHAAFHRSAGCPPLNLSSERPWRVGQRGRRRRPPRLAGGLRQHLREWHLRVHPSPPDVSLRRPVWSHRKHRSARLGDRLPDGRCRTTSERLRSTQYLDGF